MTKRRCSLIAGSAALVLVALLLLSGSASSAGKGDRSAPTAPTNLTLTAISETTASFSWSPSTDNSGKFSYRLRITNLKNSAYNTLATISQTQTTYTATFLTPNNPYAFASMQSTETAIVPRTAISSAPARLRILALPARR